MNKEQLLEGMKRAIVVCGIKDEMHFTESISSIIGFAIGWVDASTPLTFDTDIGEYLSDLFVEDITLGQLYEQLTEENNAE